LSNSLAGIFPKKMSGPEIGLLVVILIAFAVMIGGKPGMVTRPLMSAIQSLAATIVKAVIAGTTWLIKLLFSLLKLPFDGPKNPPPPPSGPTPPRW
jgi:hypothetical protein